MSPRETDEQRLARYAAETADDPTIPLDEFRRRSRRSFLTGAAGVVGAGLTWRWVQTQPPDGRVPTVLRNGYELNERIWSPLISDSRRVRTYDVSKARPLIVNGRLGIRNEIDLDGWSMEIAGPDGEVLDEVAMDVIRAMEPVEMVAEHKCIEGWSNITHWTGVRFADFAARYADVVERTEYVALETPGGGYYVGMDKRSILHPDTLLAFALGGEPLTQDHGAPLRLVAPLKYGIKSIKRIGRIEFTNERPRDYWAERGYDWYSGH